MSGSANDIGGLVESILGLVERNDKQSYRKIMVRAKNGVMPDDIKKTNMVVFQHMEFLSEDEERTTDDEFLKSLREHLISCGEIGDLGFSLLVLPTQFQGAIKNHAEKAGGAHLVSYNNKVAPFVSKLVEMLFSVIGESAPEFAESVKPENAGRGGEMAKKAAADSFMKKFMALIEEIHPQLHKGLTNSATSNFFTDTANPLAIIYLTTLVEGKDQINDSVLRVERIGELCNGLSLSSPIEGLKHYNDYLLKLLMTSGQNEENYPKLQQLHKAIAEKLQTFTQEQGIDDEVSTMEFVEGAMGVVNTLEDKGDKETQEYITMLYHLLEGLKSSDQKVYESIQEKTVKGKLPEIAEKVTANTLQYLHALSVNKSSITSETYVDVIKKVLASADDGDYLILSVVCIASKFAEILKMKAQIGGGELQETYNEVVLPAIRDLQALASEMIVDGESEDSDELGLAFNEIRKTNPDVADSIQSLVTNDHLALTLVRAIQNTIAELHEGDQQDKVEDFLKKSRELFSVDGWTYALIYGFMPAAFARQHTPKDEACEKRVADFIQKLYSLGEKLAESENNEVPASVISTENIPKAKPQASSTGHVEKEVFQWLTYSGFDSQPAIAFANEAFNDDFKGKLAKYKNDFSTPEHKASIDSHFGQFACAVSMYVVAQYKAWIDGEVAENKVVVGLEAYQELATYVAEDKDKSSENHVARLAILGALLAYTNRNMPEPGKKTKAKVDEVADLIAQTLSKKGVQLKATKSTNLFGMIETLLGTK